MTPDELRKWRQSRNLTQKEAAALIGATGPAGYRGWQDWETGRRKIPNWLPILLKFME